MHVVLLCCLLWLTDGQCNLVTMLLTVCLSCDIVQLSATLRNLADVSGTRRYFLSLGLVTELCRTMSLSTGDSDLMLNISRIFRL